MRRSAPRRRAGFSLPELLVVLVFLGLAAAVAVPAFRAPGERGVGAAAEALVRAWAEARGESARRGEVVSVELETGTGRWVALAERMGRPAPDTVARGVLPLPPGGRVSGGAAGVARARFAPLGRARVDRVWIADAERRQEVWADVWTGEARRRAR